MKIKYEKRAIKYLKTLSPSQREYILSSIKKLTFTPPKGDIKKMRGYTDGRFRLRVGTYRVIYRYDGAGDLKVLLIMDIGSRGNIYK